MGTGNLRYPGDEVAKAMIEAVIEYTEKNPNSSIKDVKIVIYHLDHGTQKVKTYFCMGFSFRFLPDTCLLVPLWQVKIIVDP